MLNYKIKKIDNFLSNQDFKDLSEISAKIKENDKLLEILEEGTVYTYCN